MTDVEGLQEILQYIFRDESLLITALTHSSYASEHGLSYERNNERLEFIGDAYLDAVVGARIFEIMGTAREGTLSRNRAAVVCEDSLAMVARNMNLGDYLLLGKGEAACGGSDKDSILADALEAVFGAVIADGGFEAGKQLILRLMQDRINLAVEGKLDNDFKSRLQEILQEKYHSVKIKYIPVSESGPDHDKSFTVNVELNGKVLGTGTGKSKAKAEQAAAENVISKGDY